MPSSIGSDVGFKGREDYLKVLSDWYAYGTRAFVLHGLGGVGKTSLAQKFAEEIKSDYDAHVFLDLQGNSKDNISATDAMLQVLQLFKVNIPVNNSEEESIPIAEIEGYYVSLLNQHRILFLLDNAKERAQIESLNKSNTVCFLVTSRESVILRNGKSYLIEQMSPEDARELLFSIASKERFDGHADELAFLARYLPMALLPIAGLLAENRMENAANLVEKYQNSKHRLELADPNRANLTVYASFELSYESLTTELQNCWRQLAVFPGNFDEPSAAAVWNIKAEEKSAREILKKLYKFNLLEWQEDIDSFRLHDLARDFLREKSNETELNALHIRAADFYKSGHLPLEKCNTLEDFNTRFEEMYHCSQAELFDRAVYVLNKNGNRKLRLLGGSPKIIMERQKLVGKFLNPESEAFNNSALGSAHKSLGELSKALELLEKAHADYEQLGLLDNVAIMLMNMGNIWLVWGFNEKDPNSIEKALTFYRQALPLNRQMGDKKAEANTLGNIGNLLLELGDTQKAREFFNEGLIIARKEKDAITIDIALENIGIPYAREGDFLKALNFFNLALQVHRKCGNQVDEGFTLGNKGMLFYDQGDRNNGCQLIKEALEIARKVGDSLRVDLWQTELVKRQCNFG